MWRLERRGGGGMGCAVKLLLSILTIGSWALALSTSTAIWILQRPLKSGPAIRLIARILVPLIRKMEVLSPSSSAASPGEEADADAAVHFFYRNDRKPTRTQSACRLAI